LVGGQMMINLLLLLAWTLLYIVKKIYGLLILENLVIHTLFNYEQLAKWSQNYELIIITKFVMRTNLMHYLSLIYFVTQPLHLSGMIITHHQEV
jgi:hypothetical protein